MKIRPALPVWLLLAAVATAQSAAPDTATHIESLRSGDWQARQKAEDALVALGVDAIPAIEAAVRDESTDFESRERLQSALNRIAQDRLVLATRITIQRQFDNPLAAFNHLAEQVGLTATPQSDAIAERARTGGPVSLQLTDTPWLAALRDLSARTGIAAEIAEPGLRLLEQPPESLRPPTDFTGSVAVVATGARRTQTLQLGEDARRGDVVLSLAVELEPKALLAESTARLRITQLKDGDGKLVRQDHLLGLTRRGPSRYIANLTLGAPGKAPRSIGLIEGELQGELVTRVERLRITDLDTLPQTVSLPDGDVEITAIITDDKGPKLVLQMPTTMTSLPSGQSIARGQVDGLQVLDQDGQPMRLSRTNTQQSIAGSIEYRFSLAADAPTAVPSTITWTIPAQTRDVRIPFKLENLPLPE